MTEKHAEIQLNWEEYIVLIEELARQVRDSGWRPNMIVCIPKGGCLPGDILSRLFKVPIGYLPAESYPQGEQKRHIGAVRFPRHLATTALKMGKRVLLVDDLDETGRTFDEARAWLRNHYPGIRVRTGMLWHKTCSKHQPNYAVRVVKEYEPGKWPWIIQPFEKYEFTGKGVGVELKDL